MGKIELTVEEQHLATTIAGMICDVKSARLPTLMRTARQISVDLNKERTTRLKEAKFNSIFQTQLMLLDRLGVQSEILSQFEEQREAVIIKAIAGSRVNMIPFLPVIPLSYLGFYGLAQLIKTRVEESPKELSGTVTLPMVPTHTVTSVLLPVAQTVPARKSKSLPTEKEQRLIEVAQDHGEARGADYIFNVDVGYATRGQSHVDAYREIRDEGRRPALIADSIAIAIHTTALVEFSLYSATPCGSDKVLGIDKVQGRAGLTIVDTEGNGIGWGTPSYESRGVL
jgi:hypothetical protein